MAQTGEGGIRVDVEGLANSITGLSDSDWAGCAETRRSHTGWVVLAGGAPVAWFSKRQESVSQSTAEAELVAVNSLANEVVWWRILAIDFGHPVDGPVLLRCDNTAACSLAEHAGSFSSTKHIELRYLRVRERMKDGEVLVQ